MIMVLPTMYRATQNPDTPNLPFAQSLSPTMFRDMQNPNEPNLPFSQKRQTYYDYIVNGDHWTFGKMVDKKVRWTESNAQQYRNKGYSVVKVGDTGDILIPKPPKPTPTGNNGYSKSYIDEHIDRLYRIHEEQEGRITEAWEDRKRIEKLKGVDYGVDIKKLYDIHGEQEGRITDAFDHRTSIESKVDEAKAEHQNIWDSVQNLWDRTDFAKKGHGHDNGNGCDCEFWDIGCKAKCGIEGIIPYILIGGLAIYAVKTRKR